MRRVGTGLILLAAAPLAAQDQAGQGVWRNYDFTPGRNVLVSTDFTGEPVGRFPAKQLTFVSGNMQIVELEGQKVLEVAANSVFHLKLPRELPPDFTVEFMLKLGAPHLGAFLYFTPLTTTIAKHGSQYLYLYHSPGVYFDGKPVANIQSRAITREFLPIKLQVDGEYLIMYVGPDRAANIPNAVIKRSNLLEFRFNATDRSRSYIKDIVVATGLDKLYEALSTTGEFTTRGILFDVDSDVLRPESTPVLEELNKVLTEHADLSVSIEGHTDNSGADDHNLALSERRAKAVVAYLTEKGIAASRVSGVGKGETAPVADNATPEGRAQNRRVVIRKK